MLDKLKQFTSGWVVQLMMLLLVISFGVWGVSDIFTGFGANSVARVGSVNVSAGEFRRLYDLSVTSLTRQFNRQFTQEELRQFDLPTQVISRLLAQATLDDAVHDMHLSMSDQKLGTMIRTDPGLLGPTGQFDKTLFGQIAQQQGLTENQFVLDRRAEYVRAQLVQGLTGAVSTPDEMMKAIAAYRGDDRKLSYLVLTAPPADQIGEPSDADLTTYFDAHKSDWKAPEYRAVSYFELSPEGIAKPGDVSDEDARKRYDAQKARFVTPGTRHVQQIVFKDKAEADTAAAALAAGTTFADLVAQRNLKPADIDLGQITRDKIVDPAVAEAAFAMSADGNSGVVDGRFGPVILHVDTIQPEVVKSFDEVKDQLKKEIATEQAAADITAMHDSIEDARAGGDDLATVAGKYGMKLVTVPAVDASGKDPDGKQIPDLPAGLVAAAFGTDVNIANDPIEPTRNTYIWYEVTALTAAHDRPLAEVRDKVVAAWKDAERDKKVTAQADDLKAKLAGGADIATVAADASLDVRTADKVTRGMQPTGELSADAVKAAFEGPKGYVAITAGALPLTRIVLVVDDSTVPAYDPKDPQLVSIKKSLDTQYQNDLLAAYITDRQSKTEVRLNQAAMSAALGISQN